MKTAEQTKEHQNDPLDPAIHAEGDAPGPNDFHITDRNAAEWLLRKLGNLKAERTRVTLQAEAITRALDADRDRLLRLYGGELEEWARNELKDRKSRTKTLHTLQGSVRFRNVPSRLSIADEAAAIGYADEEELTSCLSLAWNLDRAAYLRLAEERFKETGELLDGIESHPERESFIIAFGS